MGSNTSILNIQKLVFLLDDFHYGVFAKHLKEIHAELPLQLITAIRKKLPEFHSHSDLCCVIYGKCDRPNKLKFNQLSAHTIRLTSFLAQNYPSYLHRNVDKVEQLINEGKREQAMFLADNLLDIATFIEDFTCQIRILKILSQQAFLIKDISVGFKLSAKLQKAYDYEAASHQILFSIRKTFYQPNMGNKPANLDEVIDFYKSFHKHPAATVRILSKYARVYSTYYYTPGMFDKPKDLAIIQSLEKDLQQNSFVVFTFLFDIKGVLGFLMLNSALVRLDTPEGEKYMKQLQKHYDSVLFWKHYVNMPQMFLIAARSSQYLSKYHFLIHREDYHQLVHPGDLKLMHELIVRCEDFLKNHYLDSFYKNDVISMRMLYGGLLIFSGGDNIRKGIRELESLLAAYQQINLSGSTDSIYLCLMIGYFSMKDFERCEETFRRYNKVIKNKPIYDGNDISIHTYYYLSKWLTTGGRQYQRKLTDNYRRTDKGESPRRAMDALFAFFNLPKG